MKKCITIVMIFILLIANNIMVLAEGGEASYFGGISEGTGLPRNVDGEQPNKIEMPYKEVVFISGEPIIFEGTINITRNGNIKNEGVYKESYEIEADNEENEMERVIELRTVYQERDNQILRTTIEVDKWEETITIDGVTYELNERASSFEKLVTEELTPGVSYYHTSINYIAEYNTSENAIVRVDVNNESFGYNQPWSKVENQDITKVITNESENGNQWEMVVNLNPSQIAKKNIYYVQTKPDAFSFERNYQQRLERNSKLTYNIATNHPEIPNSKREGIISIEPANKMEGLIIPKGLEFLSGHWAEDDINQLYSLGIFSTDPHPNMKYENFTRGEYIKALCLALNLDTSKYENTREELPQIYDDVPPEHPLYKYVMTAYDNKLSFGRGNDFAVDLPITREEAFVIYIRVIGLENIEITEHPTTPFDDDSKISSWAKREIMAGYKLGIIYGDDKNLVNPKNHIITTEAGAIINRLIMYLRNELPERYIQ
ncbi:MAG: S-layer homology domain-containing protein [Eubacteriales bacterium]